MSTRLPLQPLFEKAKPESVRAFLRATGLNHIRFKKAEANGMDLWTADRCAVRCGFHPAEVWPNWVEVLSECN